MLDSRGGDNSPGDRGTEHAACRGAKEATRAGAVIEGDGMLSGGVLAPLEFRIDDVVEEGLAEELKRQEDLYKVTFLFFVFYVVH